MKERLALTADGTPTFKDAGMIFVSLNSYLKSLKSLSRKIK